MEYSWDAAADSVQIAWVRHYISGLVPGKDEATDVAVDRFGNVYVTGRSQGLDTWYDYATIKYDSDGKQKWMARYNDPYNDHDFATAIAVDHDGNVFVTGMSRTFPSSDYVTIMYTAEGTQEWIAVYDGPGKGWDYPNAICVDSLGNIYVTGQSEGPGTDNDYATIKYNPNGVEEWAARYNGPANRSDASNALGIDSAGSIYVTGKSQETDSVSNYVTIKYSPDGIQEWLVRFDGWDRSHNSAKAIVIDTSGNVYVTGRSGGLYPNSDYDTIKYSSEGVEQWVAFYDGPERSSDEPVAIVVDRFGNIYVTGDSEGSSRACHYATVKYDSDGIQQWVTQYDGPGNGEDRVKGLAVDGFGNVCVAGRSEGANTDRDYTTIKYNSAGEQQWVIRKDGYGNSFDWATALAIDRFSNVCVTGISEGFNSGHDYATVKYNSGGDRLWTVRYNSPGDYDDDASALAVDAFENVYVTGKSATSNSYPYNCDYVTIKYDPDGIQEWVVRYDGPAHLNDEATALAIDLSGNVYVTGKSESQSMGNDYATVKYTLDGIQLWVARYNGPGDDSDEPKVLAIGPSGYVYVTGRSKGFGTGYDYATVKYDPHGATEWIARYEGEGRWDDRAIDLAVDAKGNVYVLGQSEGDCVTVKYNSRGDVRWISQYDGSRYTLNEASALAVNSVGNICITGQSWSTRPYLIIRLSCMILQAMNTGLRATTDQIAEMTKQLTWILTSGAMSM